MICATPLESIYSFLYRLHELFDVYESALGSLHLGLHCGLNALDLPPFPLLFFFTSKADCRIDALLTTCIGVARRPHIAEEAGKRAV